ncbi:MAG: DUF4159 domain-containing protein [Candidatus Krumholzibacteria bacterium]|nr:DUF4159 domain-containing protein [Candidatus Krumholzibacteria bacterium]
MRDRCTATGTAVVLAVLLALCAARQAGGQERPTAGGEAPHRRAQAASLDGARLGVCRLKYGGGGDWYSDPSSLPNLLDEFERRTGVPAAASDRTIEPLSPELFECPFIYLTGHGNVAMSAEEHDRIREHLLAGGFLWADDNYGMDASFRREVARIFPGRELEPVPFGHPIYHCFYDLDGPPKIHEHDGKPPEGLGVFDGERLVLFYTYESDIGDGLEDADVHGDPAEVRELAVQMAVNILYYALTR